MGEGKEEVVKKKADVRGYSKLPGYVPKVSVPSTRGLKVALKSVGREETSSAKELFGNGFSFSPGETGGE